MLVFVGQLAGRCNGHLDRYKGEVEASLAAHGEGLTQLMFAALAVRIGDRTVCRLASRRAGVLMYLRLMASPLPPQWTGRRDVAGEEVWCSYSRPRQLMIASWCGGACISAQKFGSIEAAHRYITDGRVQFKEHEFREMLPYLFNFFQCLPTTNSGG